MRGTHHVERRAAAVVAGALLTVLPLAAGARGDDLVTLSGKTYRDAHPVRVEPDGVTWRFAEGVCKVDFTDSPKNVRDTYHYDAAKAAAYHDAQAQAQRQAGEQGQQLVQAQEDRQRVQAQTQAQAAAREAGTPVVGAPTLVYRHGLASTVQAAVRSLDEQKAAADAQAAADARNSEGLGNPAIWRYVPGVGSKPVAQRTDVPNKDEYKASSRSTGDDFFNPIYMTKSYNEDMDRAAAFARGVPLK